MDIDKVKELVDLMIANDLASISLRNENEEITLTRSMANHSSHGSPEALAAAQLPVQATPAAKEADAPQPTPEELAAQDGLVTIQSPMVGTFYEAASPDSDPYLQIGSHVSPQSVCCIIEAMKVMNEIKAEVSGTLSQILVRNGQAVEYGQVLFRVNPD